MGTINFFKYDLRRSKYLFLLSIFLFSPLAVMMGWTMESLLGVFSYMGLVVVVAPTSLFTYEQKTDCGFDGLLPATDRDKVFGRYMLGAVCILFQLILGIIICTVMSQVTNLEVSGLGVISMIFMAITLIYLSIALIAYYLIGRNLNQQIKGVIVMLPCLILWMIVNTSIGVLMDGEVDIVGLIAKIMDNKEIISALALVIGIVMYIVSALISTQIVKKKDFR